MDFAPRIPLLFRHVTWQLAIRVPLRATISTTVSTLAIRLRPGFSVPGCVRPQSSALTTVDDPSVRVQVGLGGVGGGGGGATQINTSCRQFHSIGARNNYPAYLNETARPLFRRVCTFLFWCHVHSGRPQPRPSIRFGFMYFTQEVQPCTPSETFRQPQPVGVRRWLRNARRTDNLPDQGSLLQTMRAVVLKAFVSMFLRNIYLK
ncbi:hypothetical protein IWX47DRAFT_329168 [Phyllosticta citricarpa]